MELFTQQNESSTFFIKKLISNLLKNNECLVYELAGQLFIADGYTVSDDVVKERYFIISALVVFLLTEHLVCQRCYILKIIMKI